MLSTPLTPRSDGAAAAAVEVRPAAPGELEAVVDVLATAFAVDPVMATFTGTGPDRHQRTRGFFRAVLRSGALRHGAVDVAVGPDGRVLGAAAWEAPGSAGHLPAQVAQLPTFWKALGWRGIRRALANQAALARHRPVPEHWYLTAIGVGDGARGLGVGSTLLASRLRQVDAAGSAAYLEASTPRSRALYESFGFRFLATIEALGTVTGPASMWRPARPLA